LFGENLTVAYCSFDDEIDTAIQLEYSWFCHIHHNYFQQCDVYGIYADAAGSGIAFNLIHDNYFTEVATAAIALLGGSDNNDIYANRILGAAGGTNNMINLTAGMLIGYWEQRVERTT